MITDKKFNLERNKNSTVIFNNMLKKINSVYNVKQRKVFLLKYFSKRLQYIEMWQIRLYRIQIFLEIFEILFKRFTKIKESNINYKININFRK